MRDSNGQASADYLAVVAVVATVLLAAGSAVGMPELPGTIVKNVRTALCIVGGDVCRAADARAQGLEPCVVQSRDTSRRTALTFMFVRAGQDEGAEVEFRSDGTVRLVATQSADLGATGEPSLRLGPQVSLKAGGSVGAGWRSGVAWELPDRAALDRLLARTHNRPMMLGDDLAREYLKIPPATERFFEGGTMGDLTAGAHAYDVGQPVVSAGERHALGRRVRDGLTSWYFDASEDGPRLFGGLIAQIELRGKSAWTLEVTEDRAHRPQRLEIQTTLPGPHRGEQTELSASLDLADPENAAAARDLLGLGRSPTPLALARARAVGRHMLTAGNVERRVYRVRDRPSEFDAGLNVGVFGGEHSGEAHQRDLVSAEVLGDGRSAKRADCLGT
jgi:hypothetical protein